MGSDEREFEAVFRDECRSVVRAAYLVVGDWPVAQEIAQDSFTELFVRWSRVSEYDNIGAWLRRIAIRRAVRIRRRSERTDVLMPRDSDPPDVAEQVDLRLALLALPIKQRAAVVLHYLEDLPVTEIALALGCSPATAKVHLHRARQRLRIEYPSLIEGNEVHD